MTNLGLKCKYAGECPVFKGTLKVKEHPLFLLRNVFCNRGRKGWQNCTRFNMLESGGFVGEDVNPYSKRKVYEG